MGWPSQGRAETSKIELQALGSFWEWQQRGGSRGERNRIRRKDWTQGSQPHTAGNRAVLGRQSWPYRAGKIEGCRG